MASGLAAFGWFRLMRADHLPAETAAGAQREQLEYRLTLLPDLTNRRATINIYLCQSQEKK